MAAILQSFLHTDTALPYFCCALSFRVQLACAHPASRRSTSHHLVLQTPPQLPPLLSPPRRAQCFILR